VYLKPRHSFNVRLDGPERWSGQMWRRKTVLSLLGLEARTVYPVSRLCTDYAIPAAFAVKKMNVALEFEITIRHLHRRGQDRLCTYNVMFRRVLVTSVAVENQY
jgi:hypothetical protein